MGRYARPRYGRRLAVVAVAVPVTLVLFGAFASAALAGNFFATGHDLDFHCTTETSPDECGYYKLVTTLARGGSNLPLLILDRDSTSDGAVGSSGDADSPLEAVSSLNLAYSNLASTTANPSSPPYVVEDPQGLQPTIINGTPPSGITTSSTWASTPLVNSSGQPLWSAIIVASDTNCGGCDLNNIDGTHLDSDQINARASDIQRFFNAGGGLLYLAGASDAFSADGVSGKDVYYASVPVPLGGQPVSAPFTVTSAGTGLGITDAMANCCATHNSFTLPGAGSSLQVAETDSAGFAESLFITGGTVCPTGFCVAAPPSLSTSAPKVLSSKGAAFSGSVDPEGLATTAHFEYGLDPKYGGGGPIVYDHSTPTQNVGSDFASHSVTASVAGLVPNALYHVRLVASNSAGTVDGPDVTFTTKKDPPPPSPVLGKSLNASVVSGLVLIKLPGGAHAADRFSGNALTKGAGFIPLTEPRQLPVGTDFDARRGTMRLVAATGHGHKTQQGTFSSGLFKVGQTRSRVSKGLATMTLLEGLFKGGPSYSVCEAHGVRAGAAVAGSPVAQAARLSKKILQTLHASENHGRFRTRGRYSAATVRGTKWDTVDRCDGTLTVVHRGTVSVRDFKRRKTITVHAGHSYLARAVLKKTH